MKMQQNMGPCRSCFLDKGQQHGTPFLILWRGKNKTYFSHETAQTLEFCYLMKATFQTYTVQTFPETHKREEEEKKENGKEEKKSHNDKIK